MGIELNEYLWHEGSTESPSRFGAAKVDVLLISTCVAGRIGGKLRFFMPV